MSRNGSKGGPRWLNAADAAASCSMSVKGLLRCVEAGTLPMPSKVGRLIRWDTERLQAALRGDEAPLPALLQNDEILQDIRYIGPGVCGVYFLFKRMEIVYVGKSRNILVRLGSHAAAPDMDFDEYRYVECSPEILDVQEQRYIGKFRPTLNQDYFSRTGRERVEREARDETKNRDETGKTAT